MSLLQSTPFVQTLLNYTAGVYAEKKNKVAEKLAPSVQVPTIKGYYNSYDSVDAFQLKDTSRQPGQRATMVSFEGSRNNYDCAPNALDAVIPQELLDMNDPNTARIHYESVMKELVSEAILNHEYQVLNIVNSNVTAEAGVGTGWLGGASGSAFAINPLDQIEKLYYNIAEAIGEFPNHIVVGSSAWRTVKYAYAQRGTFPAYLVNDAQVKEYFQNIGNGLEVDVAILSYANNKGQATRSTTPILGTNDLFIFYSSPMPTILDRSAFKTLQFGTGFDNVRSYKSIDMRDTFLAVDWHIQTVLTNKYAIKRITMT